MVLIGVQVNPDQNADNEHLRLGKNRLILRVLLQQLKGGDLVSHCLSSRSQATWSLMKEVLS